MIKIAALNQLYGSSQILWDLDFEIGRGKCACLMGRNGVGKTTFLKVLMGLLPLKSGQIIINGKDAVNLPAEARPALGIGYVPQGRDIFPQLTVQENLKVALAGRKSKDKIISDAIFDLFPVLGEMLSRRGGDLSGGQQQQLAIARALVIDPEILILDEPNEGIQPNIVKQISDVVIRLNRELGMTVLLVEQKINFARRMAEEFCIMERGAIVASGNMDELSDDLVKQYLAV